MQRLNVIVYMELKLSWPTQAQIKVLVGPKHLFQFVEQIFFDALLHSFYVL